MKDKNEILRRLIVILAEEFELEENKISLEMNLYQDLGLDSIDAIDLIVRLQEIAGKKIDPEVFKLVRTVNDVVNAIDDIMNEQ